MRGKLPPRNVRRSVGHAAARGHPAFGHGRVFVQTSTHIRPVGREGTKNVGYIIHTCWLVVEMAMAPARRAAITSSLSAIRPPASTGV